MPTINIQFQFDFTPKELVEVLQLLSDSNITDKGVQQKVKEMAGNSKMSTAENVHWVKK